jgi:membrane protein YdbS with pleckstrin-like domain
MQPSGQNYPGQTPAYAPEQKGSATAPLILGILSLVLFMFAPLSFVMSIIGLVLGIQAHGKHKSSAVLSIVLCILGIIISLAVMPAFLEGFMEGLEESGY